MASQKRLSELYETKILQTNQTIDDQYNLIKDLEAQIEVLSTGNESEKLRLEHELKETREHLKEKLSEMEKLQTELMKANELLGNSYDSSSQGVTICIV
jgi:uncharacterized coiled-coil DUF342 family protein